MFSKKKMRKGIIGWIGFFVAFAILLTLEYFYVSSWIRNEFIVGRFEKEAPLISEADKLETYARSFEDAVELSLLQACYDTKDQTSSLWYDYELKVKEENILNEIKLKTINNAKEYLDSYKDFAGKNAKEMKIPNSDEITDGEVGWDTTGVNVSLNEIVFHAEIKDFSINKTFKPRAKLRSGLWNVWNASKYFMKNDVIGNSITDMKIKEDECNEATMEQKINDNLKKIKDDFNSNNEDVQIKKLELEDIKTKKFENATGFRCCQVNVTVKVDMENQDKNDEKKYKFPVFNGSKVIEDYLGFIYKIRTGNALECHYVPWCWDEDVQSGLPPYYTSSKIRYDGKKLYDYCLNSTTLLERTCDGAYPSSETYNCPSGCENGRCVAYDGHHHKCIDISVEKPSKLTIRATFTSINDTYLRIFMVGLNCPESEGKNWWLKKGCSSDKCSSGEYCWMGKGSSGTYSHDFEDLTPGNYRVCVWPSSPSGYLWDIQIVHETEEYECVSDEDCDDGNPCTGVLEANGMDKCVDHHCQKPFLPEGYVCGNVTRECPSSCKNGIESVPLKDEESCSMTCDGSGNCIPCTPPECSYTTKTCNYGCKDSTRCWYGYWCPEKTCSASDTSGACQGTSECTTEAKCIAEYEPKPSCSYFDGAYRWCCWPSSSEGCASSCSWCCCWNSEETCLADCSLNDTCTYS